MRKLRAHIKTNRPLRAGLFLAQNTYQSARSWLSPRSAMGNGHNSVQYHLAAMVRVKQEGRFLPEWLAHHVNLGVEHCFIYDNNSTDDIESVMAPFIERGLATYVPWPTVPASPGAHLDFVERFGRTATWVAFFDADEFLVEATPGDLLATLQTHKSRPAVAVNMRYFGSAGHETIPHGLITERFDRADPGLNHHVKVIARPATIAHYRNDHNFYYRHGRLARTPEGRRVFGSFVNGTPGSALVLNHYVYRSREDYEGKAKRGFPNNAGAKARVRQAEASDREFRKHNAVVSPVPAVTRQATARLLEELGYPGDLYEANRASHGT